MKKIILILAAVLTVAVSCSKEEPNYSAKVSFDGKTYSHVSLNAAFYYSVDDDGYNIVLAPENIGQMIKDAVAAKKDIESEVLAKSSALFDIDIPASRLGQAYTLSSEFDIDTDDWSFYLEYYNVNADDYFSYNDNFKSGTMRVDLNKETGALKITLDAVMDLGEGQEATYVLKFDGTATESPEYIWC